MQLAYPDINDFSIARTDGAALAEAAVTTTPANAAYSYLAQDHLGTGRFLYNQSKTQTGAFEHYPYGARYSASGTAPYHEFTGKPWDADASLYYFPYRYYRPDMERWMSPDPAGLVDGPNVYGYVSMNPLNKNDFTGLSSRYPSGHYPTLEEIGCCMLSCMGEFAHITKACLALPPGRERKICQASLALLALSCIYICTPPAWVPPDSPCVSAAKEIPSKPGRCSCYNQYGWPIEVDCPKRV